ncbi:MAG: L-threonylcarbamoyladenylate synthase [bacterium]
MLLKQNIWNNENLIKVLENDGVVVMPTDTLYGIVGKAQNINVVNRIYEIRKRAPNKPCIVLISDISELSKFSINISKEQKDLLEQCWFFDFVQDFQPQPVSIILDCPDDSLEYLHRGTKTLAFRVPAQQELRNLLTKTGPLIAPSANLEGLPPAVDISEARKYFGDSISLYIDGGMIKGKPSKVIRLHKDGSVDVLRF